MLKGTIHNGQVVLPQPVDLPEGTEVEVVPIGLASWPDQGPVTTDEINGTLAAMNAIEPLEFTETECAAILTDRQERKEWEKARFYEHAKRLREIWE